MAVRPPTGELESVNAPAVVVEQTTDTSRSHGRAEIVMGVVGVGLAALTIGVGILSQKENTDGPSTPNATLDNDNPVGRSPLGPDPDAPIAGIDFRNTTYPANSCAFQLGWPSPGLDTNITVIDGRGNGGLLSIIAVQEPVFGDVDNDGQRDDAVIPLDCTTSESGSGTTLLAPVTVGSAGQLELIGSNFQPPAGGKITDVELEEEGDQTVVAIEQTYPGSDGTMSGSAISRRTFQDSHWTEEPLEVTDLGG